MINTIEYKSKFFIDTNTRTPIILNNSNLKWLVRQWYFIYLYIHTFKHKAWNCRNFVYDRDRDGDIDRVPRLEELNEMFDHHCVQWISDSNPIERWFEVNAIKLHFFPSFHFFFCVCVYYWCVNSIRLLGIHFKLKMRHSVSFSLFFTFAFA